MSLEIIDTDKTEKEDIKVEKQKESVKFNYLRNASLFLIIPNYAIYSFCILYEYIYAKHNESKYLKVYDLLKADKDHFQIYLKYLHALIFYIIFYLIKDILLFFIQDPVIAFIKKSDLSDRSMDLIDLILQVYINLYGVVSNWLGLNLFSISTYIYLFVIGFVTKKYFEKKPSLRNAFIHYGFYLVIFGAILAIMGVPFIEMKAKTPKLVDKASPAIIEEIIILCKNTNTKVENILLTIDSNYGVACAINYLNGYIICFDKEYLNKLSPREVAAILAHEIGHTKDKFTMVSVVFLIVLEAIHWTISIKLLEKHKDKYERLIIMFYLSIIFKSNRFFSYLFHNFLSKKHERFADSYAKKLGYGADFVEAITKLTDYKSFNLINSDAFQILSTHPSTIERIEFFKQ